MCHKVRLEFDIFGKRSEHRYLCVCPDCLVLLVFKDKWDKTQGTRERTSVTLEEICGLEVTQCFEGVAFTLTILCLQQAALLGFDSKETLLAWDARLRYTLGEGELIFSVGGCYRFSSSLSWSFSDVLGHVPYLLNQPVGEQVQWLHWV